MSRANKWVRSKSKKDNKYLKVFTNDDGDIKVIYPKAPKWAQRVAFEIWKDVEKGGQPTKNGVKDVVKGLWAKMIYEASKGGKQ
jgi:phage terminase small subunit